MTFSFHLDLFSGAGHFAQRQYTLLGNDLYACQTIFELFLQAGFNFILVCKPEPHVAFYEQVTFLKKTGDWSS